VAGHFVQQLGLSSATFLGILGVHNTFENTFYHFEFAVLYQANNIIESKLSSGSFVPLRKVIEGLSNLKLPILSLLAHWIENYPKSVPPLFVPEENHWHVDNPRLDLVAFVIVLNDKDELLVVEERTKLLFLPAGHFEAGETIVDCSVRETVEESGLEVKVLKISEIVYHYANYSRLHFVVIAKVVGGKLKHKPDGHSNGAHWIPLSKVAKELSQNDPKYRKPYEIGPFVEKFIKNRESNIFIPLYPLE